MGYNVAIDGPAGAGKSTIAKRVAKEKGYIYVDTGAMYRALAVYFLDKKINPENLDAIAAACEGAEVKIQYEQGEQQVYLNGENITSRLRNEEVGNMASKVSAVPEVRAHLLNLQKELARTQDVVMDGRDIGTCVLPEADVKIFLTASVETRALRRYKELEEKGHQEIVLTGIHTGRYKDNDIDLACLLKLLLENTQNVYFRISSIEITEVSDELIELILKEPRICHHLHIPVQSACDETLQRMNRPYTIEEFKNRISKIRSQISDISISTDVITGFVMESDEEFETTYQNLKEIEFSFLHVFPYSKRDGTKAASMKGEVHGTIQKERTSKLLELSKELRQKDMERYPNITVLIERKEGNTYFGYTHQYHPARIESDTILSGRILTSWDTIENGTYIVRKKA